MRLIEKDSLFGVFKKNGRRAICLSLTLLAFSIGFAPQSSAANIDLDRMETKYFHHTNPNEDDAVRIERLEKMFFGEAKEGSVSERLNSLKELVPDLDQVELEKKKKVVEPPSSRSSGRQKKENVSPPTEKEAAPEQVSREREQPRADAGMEYPAITAIEQKKLGKTFENEPVGDRLARLEKKILGRVSESNDYTDRMDQLKAKTGIDIAEQAPDGTDWAGDDVEINYPKPTAQRPSQTFGRSSYGEDGRLRQDMQRVFPNRNQTAYGQGSGNYGMNSSNTTGSSGNYGFNSSQAGIRDGLGIGGSSSSSNDRVTAFAPPASPSSPYPPVAPPIQTSTPKPMGLNQQVEALEAQIFGKNFDKDSLPERVARLEKTVFPNKNVNTRTSLPARVAQLASVIPIQSRNLISSNSQNYGYQNQNQSQNQSQDPNQNQPRQRGGLSKVLGAMGNFISGGFSVGSYPMSGNLMTDPQTGLYLDRTSGNLIDPHTGMVVGRKGLNGYNSVSPGYGYGYNNTYGNPYGNSYGYNSFNNGFSPPVNTYGMGGTGIRFGTGFGSGYGTGFGTGFGTGGMWP